MSFADIHLRAHRRIADRLRRHPVRVLVALVVLGMAIASAVHFNGAGSRATSTAPAGSPAGTLPAEGVFESCSLDSEMPTCLGRLQAMHQGGMQVVVITAWAGSLDSLRTYASAAQSLGMSVMWELSDPSWWDDPATSTGAAGQFPAFVGGCGCDQNGPLLAYMIRWLGGLPGTYGYYAADDCVLPAGDQAGVTSYVSQIKAQDPVHTVMIGAYGRQQADSYQGIADVIGAELYPVSTGSLMPVSTNESAWDSFAEWASQTQQAADAAAKQSAFILQAFTWGDNLSDGQAIGVCTAADTQQSCYDKLVYPSPSDQLKMRNEVLLNAHPKLILWWSFPGTYGQAGSDTYSIFPSGAQATARWNGLTAAIQAPFPTPLSAQTGTTAGTTTTNTSVTSTRTSPPTSSTTSAPPTSDPAVPIIHSPRSASRIAIPAVQQGSRIHGSVNVSAAGAGGSLQVYVLASRRSLGEAPGRWIRVAALVRAHLKAGTAGFRVALCATAERALRRHRLTVLVGLSVRSPRAAATEAIRRITILT